MKKLTIFLILAVACWACGSGGNEKSDNNDTATKPSSMVKSNDGQGVPVTSSVTLNDPLDEDMIENGKAIYQLKCAACHKLSDKRVVGPGWEGLTKKREPEWIINMITNVDMMLEQDPIAQKLLEECLTRMPNQNVSKEDARDILEFMYQNDKERGVY